MCMTNCKFLDRGAPYEPNDPIWDNMIMWRTPRYYDRVWAIVLGARNGP